MIFLLRTRKKVMLSFVSVCRSVPLSSCLHKIHLEKISVLYEYQGNGIKVRVKEAKNVKFHVIFLCVPVFI